MRKKKSDDPTAGIEPANKLALETEVRRKVAVSLADRRKSIPASVVFKRLRRRVAATPYSSR